MRSSTADEALAAVPLFKDLTSKEIREISNLTAQMNLPAGRTLTKQGEAGREFFIVIDGVVDVLIDGVVVATHTAGQFYGEIALLEDRPRTATVVAKTDVTIDIIGRREFLEMLELQPQLAERLRKAMAGRLASDHDRSNSHRDGPGAGLPSG